MGIFSKFEGRVEDTFEGAANKMFDSPISPVQIAKKAEKQMRREKIVGAGKQYAPTLYTVLVNIDDDHRLFGYYPTLAGETETYLSAKAASEGLVMDGHPLVRFIADESLKHGKFDVIAELVASPIIEQLRDEEMDRYGIGNGAPPMRGGMREQQVPQRQGYGAPQAAPQAYPQQGFQQPMQNPNRAYDDYGYDQAMSQGKPPLPYVPENEIDYSIDYGKYTFNSQDFDDYRQQEAANSPGAYDASYDDDQFAPNRFGGNDQYAQDPRDEFDRLSQGRFDDESFSNQKDNVVKAYDALYGRRPSEPLADPAAAAGGFAAAAAQAHAPAPMPVGVPNTVVFAAGSGNAQPTPNAQAVRACLLNATDNRTYDLATSRLLLGRESSSDIVVDDINASRTHAEIRFEPQGVWTITDLGSTNGTLVNGREVTTQALRDGDYITIGMTNFVFIQA